MIFTVRIVHILILIYFVKGHSITDEDFIPETCMPDVFYVERPLSRCYAIRTKYMIDHLVCRCGIFNDTYTKGYATRNDLFSALFTNYNTSIRPYCGNNNVTNSTMDIAIRQLIKLDEPSQILKMNVWLRWRWYDCQLTWSPSNNSNIEHLIVPFKKVWVPDIVLFDSVIGQFEGLKNYRPIIYSNGMVHYNFPTVMQCSCKINVRYFPFDTQTCILDFGSWVYSGFELDIFPKRSYGELSSTKSNSEWNFVSLASARTVSYFGCCPEPFPVVTYYLKLQRKSLHYVVNLFIPTIIISLIGMFSFILPVESGEKVGLEVTIMLSLSVFLLLIGDTLPPSSDNFPLIGYYFAFTMVLVGFATVMTVLVLNLFYKESKSMPVWVKYIFLDRIGRVVLVTWPIKKSIPEDQTKTNQKEGNFKIIKLTRSSKIQDSTKTIIVKPYIPEQDQMKDEIEEGRDDLPEEPEEEWIATPEDWKKLSIILDRLSFLLYILITIIGSIAIFSPLVTST